MIKTTHVYNIKKFNPKYLTSMGYKHDYYRSSEDTNVYYKRFCVYKWGIIPTLDAVISVWDTKEVRVDVYEAGTNNCYAAFYCPQGTPCSLIKIITPKINKQLKIIGVNLNEQ